MVFGLKASSLDFLRLNLGPKAVMSAALLIAVNTALVAGAGYWSLTRDFDARARHDIDVNLRTLTAAPPRCSCTTTRRSSLFAEPRM